ncbi:MAG: OmpA family protein [Pseudomonadota bacterium]
MNRTVILILGVIAQCVLTALFLWRVAPLITDDIETRSVGALRDAGINWAQISVDGRDVTLEGLAPSEEQRDRALASLDGVAGIRRIDDTTTVMQRRTPPAAGRVPAPVDENEMLATLDQDADLARFGLQYVFRIERGVAGMALRGMVPDDATRDALLSAARLKFPEMTVEDNLLLNTNAPEAFEQAARQAISVAGLVANGAVGLRDQVFFVEGLTVSDRDLDRLRNALETALPDGYDLALQVGSRQTLSALMRENPDLAARVGRLPTALPPGPLVTVTRPPERKVADTVRCQNDVNAALAREPVAFRTGSSLLQEGSDSLLAQLVDLLKSCPTTRVEIAGHTDDQGSELDNLQLSQARAEAVMEYLVRNGIKLGRMTAVGYGERQPLVENRTAEDRAKNRRIELRVSDGA